jgi:hypothetical protein
MDEVVKMFASPVFWVGTVVVGLAINFGTQWAYGRLAAIGSGWAQARVLRRKNEFEKDAAFIAAYPEGLPLQIAAEARHRWYATIWLIFSVLFLICGIYVRTNPKLVVLSPYWMAECLTGVASVCIFFCMASTTRASQKRSVLTAIERSLRSSFFIDKAK